MVLYGFIWFNGFIWNKPGLIWFFNAYLRISSARLDTAWAMPSSTLQQGSTVGCDSGTWGTRPMGVPWKSRGDGWTGWMDRLDGYGFVLKEGIPLESPNGQFT
jgi:hypothetical protein